MSSIFCISCGTRNQQIANYCFKCGTKLQKEEKEAKKDLSLVTNNKETTRFPSKNNDKYNKQNKNKVDVLEYRWQKKVNDKWIWCNKTVSMKYEKKSKSSPKSVPSYRFKRKTRFEGKIMKILPNKKMGFVEPNYKQKNKYIGIPFYFNAFKEGYKPKYGYKVGNVLQYSVKGSYAIDIINMNDEKQKMVNDNHNQTQQLQITLSDDSHSENDDYVYDETIEISNNHNDNQQKMKQSDQFETNWDKVVESFENMNLKEDLFRGICSYGFGEPSEVQQRGILPIIQKRDVMVQAQYDTGTDKIAAYGIAALQRLDLNEAQCQVLVLAPTRELAQQIHKVIKSLGTYLDVIACA
eukprot:462599_1